MDKKKLTVKNSNVKLIFEKMDYGEILENTSLAKAWLNEHRKEVFSYVDKKNVGSKGASTVITDVNTGENMCTVYSPIKSDVEKIILRAKQLNSWFSMKPEQRAVLINRLANEIYNNSVLLCQLEICLRGISSVDTKTKVLPLLIDYLQYYSSWAVNTEFTHDIGLAFSFISDNSFVGFLGCILGPSLAAGYNLLLQAAPKLSPLVLLIIELAESVGIPEGTLKLIPGSVDHDAIFQNENVAVITSFGNINAEIKIPIGKTFLAITNSKSPMIIFNSADIDSACDSVIDAAWGYQGLLPWSINTLLVQEDVFQIVIDKLKCRLNKIKIASATDKTADLSYPSEFNANKQLHMLINEAKLQGIEVFQNCEKTDIFQPTLLIGGRVFGNNVIKDDDYTAALTVLAFRTAAEAINLANNSRCGFAASVWTENIGLANEVAKGLDVGNVWVNSNGIFTASAAFSPYKKSGYGIFGGSQGFYEFVSATTGERSADSILNIKPLKTTESTMDKNVYKCLVGNDFHNVVMLAKSGYQSWRKTSTSFKSQFLRTVANEICKDTAQLSQILNSSQEDIEQLIRLFYSASTYLKAESTISTHSTYNIQSYYDPIGVIVIEAPDHIEYGLVCTILGSLSLGNAVIILSTSSTSAQFCIELSKIMSRCNIVPGIFSVITHCDDNVIKAALSDREINLYIEHSKCNIRPKVEHMQRCYSGPMNWREIFNRVTLIKNVWFNIGDSVL